MKTHCDKKGRDKFWYVNIQTWRNLSNVHFLFRGDSDPMLLCNGKLYDYYSIEDYLDNAFEEDKASWEEDNDEEYPYKSVDDWIECFEMVADDLFWSDYSVKSRSNSRHNRLYNHKNMDKKTRQHLSAEEKRVMKLASILPDITNKAIGNRQAVVDDEWDAHNCSMLTFGQTIQDYQVLRVFDVEYEPSDPIDRATQEEIDAIEEEEGRTNCYDEAWEALVERLYEETGDAYHEYEVGECVQYWLNVKTGEVTMLGKVWNDNPKWCDMNEDATWEVIRKSTKRGKAFRETFEGNFGEGHYKDLSVHPLLIKRGYSALDAMDWYYGCGEKENKSSEAKFFDVVREYEGNYVNFLQGLALGVSEWEQKLKMYGLDNLVQMCEVKDKIRPKDYLTALKICKRNSYVITDRNLWNDMLIALIDLQKDIHNAHYVCPADLQAAHDRWINLAARKKEEIRKRKAMEEAIRFEEEYAERLGKFMKCYASNEHFNIFVCPTVADMAVEGSMMHHCVYKMGYYKAEKNCVILFVRDKEGNRIATSEVKLGNWSVVQTRGNCNQMPTFNGENCYDEINSLISNNLIPQLQKANIVKKAKIITHPAAEQPQEVALAA